MCTDELCFRRSSDQERFFISVALSPGGSTVLGMAICTDGMGKLQHLAKVANFFASLGIPAPAFSAVTISWLELVGGIGLVVGLGSRFSGLLLAGDMFVAYLAASRPALLAIFSDPGKFYSDDAYTFLFASVLILIFGPGKCAVDVMLKRMFPRPRRAIVTDARVGARRRSASESL